MAAETEKILIEVEIDNKQAQTRATALTAIIEKQKIALVAQRKALKESGGTNLKAAKNVPGLDVVSIKCLNVKLLSPGSLPGRVTLWTQPALELAEKESLFM